MASPSSSWKKGEKGSGRKGRGGHVSPFPFSGAHGSRIASLETSDPSPARSGFRGDPIRKDRGRGAAKDVDFPIENRRRTPRGRGRGKPSQPKPTFTAVEFDYESLEKSTLTTNDHVNGDSSDEHNSSPNSVLNDGDNGVDNRLGFQNLSLEPKSVVPETLKPVSFFVDKSPNLDFIRDESFEISDVSSPLDHHVPDSVTQERIETNVEPSSSVSEIQLGSPEFTKLQFFPAFGSNLLSAEKSTGMDSSVENSEWETPRFGLGFHHSGSDLSLENKESTGNLTNATKFPDFTSPGAQPLNEETNDVDMIDDDENKNEDHTAREDEFDQMELEDTEDELDRLCGLKKGKKSRSLSTKPSSAKPAQSRKVQNPRQRSKRNNESDSYFVVGGMKIFSSRRGDGKFTLVKEKKRNEERQRTEECKPRNKIDLDHETIETQVLNQEGLLNDLDPRSHPTEEMEQTNLSMNESDESNEESVEQEGVKYEINGEEIELDDEEEDEEEDDDEDEDEEEDEDEDEDDDDEESDYDESDNSIDDVVLEDYLDNMQPYSDGELDSLLRMVKNDMFSHPKVEDMGIFSESDDERKGELEGRGMNKPKRKGKGISKGKEEFERKTFVVPFSHAKQERKNFQRSNNPKLSYSYPAQTSFLSEHEKFLNANRKFNSKPKSKPWSLPGENKKLRKEAIKQKRAQRMAKKGLDLISINKDLIKLAKNEIDMLALPPLEHKERLAVYEIAKIYRLKPNLQGTGRKSFVIINRTAHTSMPNAADGDRLSKILERSIVGPAIPKESSSFKGKSKEKKIKSYSTKLKKQSSEAKEGNKKNNSSLKSKIKYSKPPSQRPMTFVSSGVIVGDISFNAQTEDNSTIPTPNNEAESSFAGTAQTEAVSNNDYESRVSMSKPGWNCNNTLPMRGFGEFEAHTKGFGSKMMEKMGFKPGSGLGKDGRGISSALSAVIRPKKLGLGAEL